MKIWIFEPYSWDYCGGALVIVAESVAQCQELMNAAAEAENAASIKQSPPPKGTTRKPDYQTLHEHEPSKKTRIICNHWLLTHTLETTETEARILVENWNYS